VLETQKTIVTEKLTESADIDVAIAAQELAQGISVAPDLRVQLVDLMTRLAAEDIDWSTFSAGWTIERQDNTRITMTGDGIAIRNARLTATAQAEAEMRQTAQAADDMTATAEAESRNATSTAQASLDLTATAHGEATNQAIANLTATALAQPTPAPTATPEPVSISGKIVETHPGAITIEQDKDDRRSTFRFAANLTVERNGDVIDAAALGKGDSALLTLDGSTHEIIHVSAEPAPSNMIGQVVKFGLFLLTGTALTAVVVVRKRREEPFIVTISAT
jgi:hypothetical protein